MRFLAFTRWLLVPLALYIAVLVVGLPHVRWSYTWRDDGQGFDPLANRFYTRCSFIGPTGQYTIHHPDNGRCAWIIFRKSSDQHGELL